MLYGGRTEFHTYGRENCVALGPVLSIHADLDEFVGLQGGIDLVQDRRRKAVAGDADNRMEVVSLRAKGPPLCWREFNHHSNSLKKGRNYTAMKRSKTSKSWMMEHVNDPFVQRAKTEGMRARAAYKLMEIDEKDKLFRSGMTVVDLGAAPGSWSQVAVGKVGGAGRVFALDLLPMEPIPGVHFMQGDFHDDAFVEAFEVQLGDGQVDLVLSDIAPNISGISSSDQARSIHLAELALDFAARHLAANGRFLVKVFQGEGFDDYRKAMGEAFRSVVVRKPQASRGRSAEVYLLGTGKRS